MHDSTPNAARTDAFGRLVGIMTRLRAPDGCPWDRQQTLPSLKAFLLEETYELLEAIDADDPAKVREEVGDVLFQCVFLSELARERGWFDVHDVAAAMADKLVRRHPWVFGDQKVADPQAALTQWEILKARERRNQPDASVLSGVPRELPALLQALRLGHKAAKVGFDWKDLAGVLDKLDEELAEFRQAALARDVEHTRRELGDFLFAVAQLARKLELDPEDALRTTNRRFIARFQYVERRLRESGQVPEEAGIAEMDRLWEEAKDQGL